MDFPIHTASGGRRRRRRIGPGHDPFQLTAKIILGADATRITLPRSNCEVKLFAVTHHWTCSTDGTRPEQLRNIFELSSRQTLRAPPESSDFRLKRLEYSKAHPADSVVFESVCCLTFAWPYLAVPVTVSQTFPIVEWVLSSYCFIRRERRRRIIGRWVVDETDVVLDRHTSARLLELLSL